MYVGGLLNNVEQHANIDHNNDVDNPHYTCKELRIQQPSVSLPVVSCLCFHLAHFISRSECRTETMFLSDSLELLLENMV